MNKRIGFFFFFVFLSYVHFLTATPELDLPPEYDKDHKHLLSDYDYTYDEDVEDPEESVLERKTDALLSWRPSANTLFDYEAIKTYIKTKYQKITEEDAEDISKSLVEYGEKNNIDPKMAAALIARESSFNKEAVSVTGAKGLGQIKDFNFKQLNISDPHNIQQNVSGTTQYLSFLLGKWKEGIANQQAISQNKMGAAFKNHNPELLKQAETDEREQLKLTLASYYKGFTAVNKEGVDEKTNKYVDDIFKFYDEIKASKDKLLSDAHQKKNEKDLNK